MRSYSTLRRLLVAAVVSIALAAPLHASAGGYWTALVMQGCAPGDRIVQVGPASWTVVPRPDFDSQTAPLSELACRHLPLASARARRLRFIVPMLHMLTEAQHDTPFTAGAPGPRPLASYNYDEYLSGVWQGAAVEPIPNHGTSGQPMWIAANADWNVPHINQHCYNQALSVWVGLGGSLVDGSTSGSILQLGTDSVDQSSCAQEYYAWYENYPNPPIVFSSFPVASGDVMYADASYCATGSCFPGQAGGVYTMEDITKNAWTEDVSPLSAGEVRESAEAIAEYDAYKACSGYPCYFPGFDQVQFSGVDETPVGGQAGVPLCNINWTEWDVVNHTTLAHEAAQTPFNCTASPQIIDGRSVLDYGFDVWSSNP